MLELPHRQVRANDEMCGPNDDLTAPPQLLQTDRRCAFCSEDTFAAASSLRPHGTTFNLYGVYIEVSASLCFVYFSFDS